MKSSAPKKRVLDRKTFAHINNECTKTKERLKVMDKYFTKAIECVQEGEIKKAIALYQASIIQFKNTKSALALGKLYQEYVKQLDMRPEEALQEARIAYKMGAEKGDKECRKLLIKTLCMPPKNLKEATKEILILDEYIEEKLISLITRVLSKQGVAEKLQFLEECCAIIKNNVKRKVVQKYIVDQKQLIKAQYVLEKTETSQELLMYLKEMDRYKENPLFCDTLKDFYDKYAKLLMQEGAISKANELLLKAQKDKDVALKYHKSTIENVYLWLARSFWLGINNADINKEMAIKYYKACKTNIADEEVLERVKEEIEKLEYEEARKHILQYNPNLKSKIDRYISDKEENERQKRQGCLNKAREELLKKWHALGFEGFLHTTEMENFLQIIKEGKLIPRNILIRDNRPFNDKANQEVVQHTNKWIKDCSRFYYYFKTPTNFLAKYKHPVILVFSENLVYDKNAIFSSGNASRNSTYFTDDPIIAANEGFVKWDAVFERGYYSNSKYHSNSTCKEDISAIRNTEFLIKGEVSTNLLKKVYFKTQEDLNEAKRYCDQSIINKSEVRREKFDD